LSWPIVDRSLREHIDHAEALFVAYQRLGFGATCELRMQGAHYVTGLQFRGSRLADDVLAFIANHRVRATDHPGRVGVQGLQSSSVFSSADTCGGATSRKVLPWGPPR
jgi:hypothetical protein